MLGVLLETTLTPGVDNAPIPTNTTPLIIPAIDEAFDAGLLTGTEVPTAYEIIGDIIEAFDYQRRYYRHGLQRDIKVQLAAASPAPATPAPAPPVPAPALEPRTRAPKLNPPKPFDGTQSEYKNFMMQLNLIFSSDPDHYQNQDRNKIAYAASYLSGSAKAWFQPRVDNNGEIGFTTWREFMVALKAAFDDPDAY